MVTSGETSVISNLSARTMTKITNPMAIIVIMKNIWILWEIAKCDTLKWTEQMLLNELCRWPCCMQDVANLQFVNNALSLMLKKKKRKEMHICWGMPVERMDKYTLCVYVYKIWRILYSSIFKYFQMHSLFKLFHVQLFSCATQL